MVQGGWEGFDEICVRIRTLEHHRGLPLPTYATSHASGLDLHAAVEESLRLDPLQRALIPTGICLELPKGFEAQVRPRSGLAWRHGLTLLNTPGTIDSDYRGEIQVLMVNLGEDPYWIRRGDRIAQLVVQPVVRVRLCVEDRLQNTQRGAGGFGHTGR